MFLFGLLCTVSFIQGCRGFPDDLQSIVLYGPFVSRSSVDVSLASGRSGSSRDNTDLIKEVFIQNAVRKGEGYGVRVLPGDKEKLSQADVENRGIRDVLSSISGMDQAVLIVYDMEYSREYDIGSKGRGRDFERKIFFKAGFSLPGRGCSGVVSVTKVSRVPGPEFIPEAIERLYKKVIKRIDGC